MMNDELRQAVFNSSFRIHHSAFFSRVLRAKEENDRCRDDQIQERHRQQKLPTEVHQLIEAEAGQRAAQPDVEKEKEDDFAEKIEDAENWKRRHAGAVPT